MRSEDGTHKEIYRSIAVKSSHRFGTRSMWDIQGVQESQSERIDIEAELPSSISIPMFTA